MRPVPIPEPYRSELGRVGARFKVWIAPSGDLLDDEVRPVEAATYECSVRGAGDDVRDGQTITSVIIQLEEGDLEALQQTGMFEFGVWGDRMPVFLLHPLRYPTIEELMAMDHESHTGEGEWCYDCGINTATGQTLEDLIKEDGDVERDG
jgi:hypothetical protein